MLDTPLSTPQTPSPSVPVMQVENLGKTVTDSGGSLAILRDVSFTLQHGDTVAIVGASGSGKSTLLSLMAGLDVPSTGTVHVQGQDLFARSEDQRAQLRGQHMAFVFQSFQLMAGMTALENVMLPLELLGVKDAKQRATEMLTRVGLQDRLGHYPKVLSGGEQQRVALARAFVVRPAILLADEPTGSLDHATGQSIMDLMFDLNRAQGTTLVLVTHDREMASRCKRVLEISAGELVSAPQVLGA